MFRCPNEELTRNNKGMSSAPIPTRDTAPRAVPSNNTTLSGRRGPGGNAGFSGQPPAPFGLGNLGSGLVPVSPWTVNGQPSRAVTERDLPLRRPRR
jgi:hypothetical protein